MAAAAPVMDEALLRRQQEEERRKLSDMLNKRMDEKWTIGIRGRPMRDARWFRNIRFQSGEQWITINPTSYKIEPRALPTPDFPRAITNKYAKINSDIIAALIGQSVPLNPRPSTGDPDDKASAEIADIFTPVIEEETEWDEFEETLASWMTLTGNAFLLPWYDYDEKWGMKSVDYVSCPECKQEWPVGSAEVQDGVCPTCPPPQMSLGMAPAPEDGVMQPEESIPPPMGVPLEETQKEMPIGRLRTDVVSPFEIIKDNRIPISQPLPWFFRRFRLSVDDAKKKWPEFKDKISENMPDMQAPSSVDYMEVLAYVGSRTLGAPDNSKSVNGVIYYEAPCPEYPNGLCVTRIGKDLIVEVDELRTTIGAGQRKGQHFLPIVHLYGDVLPGSAWGKPRADDLVHMQHRRNVIESALQLTAQRTGTPKLLVPENANIKNVTGQAGQVFYNYRPYSLGTGSPVSPHYLEAALGNVAPLVGLLQMIDDGMESVAGTNFLTGGDAPAGVTAASALALLDERAVRSIGPLKRKWARAKKQWLLICLEIARQHWTDERMLITVGRNKQWQVEKFKGADFKGSIDFRVDYEALMPRSKAREAADIQLATQLNLINPVDPETSYAALESFGLTRLKGSVDEAVAQAEREFDRFINEGKPPMLLPGIQNSIVHLQQHLRDANSQEMEMLRETNPQLALVFDQHILATRADIFAAQVSLPPVEGESEGSSQGGALVGASTGEKPNAPEKKGRAAVAANRGEAPPADAEPPMTGANARR